MTRDCARTGDAQSRVQVAVLDAPEANEHYEFGQLETGEVEVIRVTEQPDADPTYPNQTADRDTVHSLYTPDTKLAEISDMHRRLRTGDQTAPAQQIPQSGDQPGQLAAIQQRNRAFWPRKGA